MVVSKPVLYGHRIAGFSPAARPAEHSASELEHRPAEGQFDCCAGSWGIAVQMEELDGEVGVPTVLLVGFLDRFSPFAGKAEEERRCRGAAPGRVIPKVVLVKQPHAPLAVVDVQQAAHL